MQLILSSSVITIMAQAKLFSTRLALTSRYLDERNTQLPGVTVSGGSVGLEMGAVVGAAAVPSRYSR